MKPLDRARVEQAVRLAYQRGFASGLDAGMKAKAQEIAIVATEVERMVDK